MLYLFKNITTSLKKKLTIDLNVQGKLCFIDGLHVYAS